MNIEITNNLQERLYRHFNTFRTVKLEGQQFQTMPRKEDIPTICDVNYDKQSDIFLIMLENPLKNSCQNSGNISLLEGSDGRVIGLKICNARKSSLEVLRRELLNDFEKEMKKFSLRDNLNINLLSDCERRKFAFFTEILDLLPKLINKIV